MVALPGDLAVLLPKQTVYLILTFSPRNETRLRYALFHLKKSLAKLMKKKNLPLRFCVLILNSDRDWQGLWSLRASLRTTVWGPASMMSEPVTPHTWKQLPVTESPLWLMALSSGPRTGVARLHPPAAHAWEMMSAASPSPLSKEDGGSALMRVKRLWLASPVPIASL